MAPGPILATPTQEINPESYFEGIQAFQKNSSTDLKIRIAGCSSTSLNNLVDEEIEEQKQSKMLSDCSEVDDSMESIDDDSDSNTIKRTAGVSKSETTLINYNNLFDSNKKLGGRASQFNNVDVGLHNIN